MTMHIFLSHSTQDHDVVAAIADAVQGQGLQAWLDVRQLTAGDKLEPEIRTAIEGAAQFVVVLSPSALKSPWVRKEIEYAQTVAAGRDDGYKLIPVLIDDVPLKSVESLLGDQLVPNLVAQSGGDDQRALALVRRALEQRATILVFDNMESVLPAGDDSLVVRGSPDPHPARPRVSPNLETCGRTKRRGRETCAEQRSGRTRTRSRRWSKPSAATPAAWCCWPPKSPRPACGWPPSGCTS